MIGCATVLGLLGFGVGFVAAWVTGSAHLTPLSAGAMTGGMTFAAALFLILKDQMRHCSAMKRVRRRLQERDDVDAERFCHSLSECDPALLLHIREAVATFFDVPLTNIHPDDHLRTDYQLDVMEPGFHTVVIFHVLAQVKAVPGPFTFSLDSLTGYREFSAHVQNIVKELESGTDDNDT
jgi:hypothetical protein